MKIEFTKEELLLIHGACFNEMLNMSKHEKEYKQYLDEEQIKARHETLDYIATKVLNAHNNYAFYGDFSKCEEYKGKEDEQ